MSSITSKTGEQIKAVAPEAPEAVDPATLMSREDVFIAVAAHQISVEQAKARMAELEVHTGKITPKAALNSGAVSFYGLGRNPITMYRDQIEAFHRQGLLLISAELKKFLDGADALLERRNDSDEIKAHKKALRAKAAAAGSPLVAKPKA
ncbi:MAG TPA: hypothetical protein VFT58_01655 [Nitrososphaera sp.]|nr:hypothetical protein [Nitrososphaera sp.]